MNADPRVMEWFPSLLTRERSDPVADVIDASLREQGWGLWAVEVPGVAEFIGFAGLNPEDVLGYPAAQAAGASPPSTGAAATRPRPRSLRSPTASASSA